MIYMIGGEMFMDEVFNNKDMVYGDDFTPIYITKQSAEELVTINGIKEKMSDIRWGLLGNVKNNGCGIIASYNIMASKSPLITFEDVLSDIKKRYGAFLAGLFGVKPWTLYNYLSEKFRFHWKVFFKTEFPSFDAKTQSSNAMIILVKWKGKLSMHYIAGIWHKNTESDAWFTFYNTGVQGDNHSSADGQPMTIQAFLSLLKKQGHTVLALMGFSNKNGAW